MQFLLTLSSILAQITDVSLFQVKLCEYKATKRDHESTRPCRHEHHRYFASNTETAESQLFECLIEIRAWMNSIWLNFNSTNRNKAALTSKDFA